jgi:hypothetical protein
MRSTLETTPQQTRSTSTSPATRSRRPHHHPSQHPPGTSGFIALDWKGDRLVGIDILDASTRLHHDLLEGTETTG